MNSYLLLRDNQELGPYSIGELKALPLQSDDFVWINGQSLTWERPANVPELKALLTQERSFESEESRFRTDDERTPASYPAATLQNDYSRFENNPSFYNASPATNQSLDTTEPETVRTKESFLSRFAWVFVSAAILLTAFLITKLVTGSGNVVMPKKITASAPKVLDNTENFQNALTREIIFVPDSSKTKPKKVKPKDLKKFIEVTNNDYRVGLFGGINDLALTVQNNSDQLVDKIIIQVDYLKPNGEVITSETVSTKDIKPNGSKTIRVPSSSRGVKIKHKIVEVQSHEFKPAMSEV